MPFLFSGAKGSLSKMKRQRNYVSSRNRRPIKQTAGKRTSVVVPGVTRTAGAYARNMNRDEKKWLDTDHALATIASTGLFMPTLNGIRIGQDVNSRIGNRVCLKNINCYVTAQAAGSNVAGSGDDVVRFILYLDHQANGAAATITDILKGPTPTYDSFRNMNQAERFTILKDKFITLSGLQGAGTGFSAHNPKFFKVAWKGNVFLHFGADTGFASDLRSNNVGILLITKDGDAKVQVHARIKYTDS